LTLGILKSSGIAVGTQRAYAPVPRETLVLLREQSDMIANQRRR
jgi:hypothetical protein